MPEMTLFAVEQLKRNGDPYKRRRLLKHKGDPWVGWCRMNVWGTAAEAHQAMKDSYGWNSKCTYRVVELRVGKVVDDGE